MPDLAFCPSCGAAVSAETFQCNACELLLNPEPAFEEDVDLTDAEDPPSIIQGVLCAEPWKPGDGTGAPLPPESGNDEKTRPVMPVLPTAVPKVLLDIAEAVKRVYPFEAYVLSFIDGSANVIELGRATKLADAELEAILHSLIDRGVVEMGSAKSVDTHQVLQEVVALERGGKVEEAIEVLERAISQAKNAGALYNRLSLVVLKCRRDLGRARALLEKAIEIEPSNEKYRRNLELVEKFAREHAS